MRALVLLTLLAGNVAIADGTSAPWRDDFTSRLAALALLQSLNSDLLSHDSATLTLDRWCASHQLANPATITAERIRNIDKQPTAEQRELLKVGATEPVRYRRVHLKCGVRVLSEADNWYVPSRLTKEMNRSLENSDIAFGRAVQALDYRRRTQAAELLWRPLPEGWEMSPGLRGQPAPALQIPHEVLRHRAMLTLPDGTPFSMVVETYTAEVLGFPEPRR
jgi:chorismate-pyruvate lyase